MTISINIRRTVEGPRKPANGLAGAFGATVPSGSEIEEVEISVPKSVDLDIAAAAAAGAFSAAHGQYLTDEEEGDSPAIIDEEDILAETNLEKVRDAFRENGLTPGIASDVITTMQNKGILFRERSSHSETLPVPPYSATTAVLEDISAERRTHEGRGYDAEHDALHGIGHLADEATLHLGKWGETPTRHELVVAASLIVAALELIDRQAEKN